MSVLLYYCKGMINIIFDQFLDKCKLMPEKDKPYIDAFLNYLVGSFEGENFADLRTVIRLYYGNGKSLGKAQYYRRRKLVIALYECLLDEGAIDREIYEMVCNLKLNDIISEDELTTYYFKDLKSVLNYIKNLGAFFGLGSDDDLLQIKAIVILIWYQIDVNDMPNIKKVDLDDLSRSVQVGDKNIIVGEPYYDILKKYAEAITQMSFPKQKLQKLDSSPYLFRSEKRPRLTYDNLICSLKRFNREAGGRQLLSYSSLKRNGIFEMTYKSECEEVGKSAGKLISNYSGVDRNVAFGYVRLYQRWKGKYHKNDFQEKEVINKCR